MPILEWSAKLETGVFEIDLQHRSLLAIANQLDDALGSGKAERTVEWMLEELALYTRFHFDTEEAYMRRYGLDMTHEHRTEHGELLRAMKRFRRQLKAGDDEVEEELSAFLAKWLEAHLTGADREFGQAIQAAMRQPVGRAKKSSKSGD